MSDSLAPAVETAWVYLVHAGAAVVSAVEADVKSKGFPPLSWYDVVLELSRAGREEGLRQNELERRLLFKQYNLSRLLDRLEEAKFVERRPCPEDGRGFVVAITAAGRQFQKRVWPAYRDSIAAHVAGKLTSKEATELGRLLKKLVAEKSKE